MEYYRPEPATPEKKESSVARSLFQGLGCFVLMAFVGFLVAGRFRGIFLTPGRVVKMHIEAINDGDFRRAYRDFDMQYRSTVSFETFHSGFGDFVEEIPCRRIDLDETESHGSRATVEGLLTGSDGALVAIHYELVKEQGKWRIKSYEWTPPGDLTPI